MKRRLLTVGHSYVVGLNRRLAHELARVGKDKWEISVVAPRYFAGSRDLRAVPFQPLDDEPCQVNATRAYLTSRVHVFCYGVELRRLLARRWDVVHCWEEPFILAGGQIAAWTPPGAKLVIATFQNWSKKYPPPFRWIENMCVRRAAGWIPFGETVYRALVDRPVYGARPHRLIPPGVDTDRFQPDRAAGAAVRSALGWRADGPPVIGFMGRFLPEKGLALLMKAIECQSRPWRALFVGAGPLETELRQFASFHGDRVRVCSDVRHDDVPRYLNAMDMLCAPSQTTPRWREQFGRMLIEGFACGLPVIGSDSGEIPFVIRDDGVVLPEADVEAWAGAIRELIDSTERRRLLSDRARARALADYTWSVIARRHLDFFEFLLERKK